MTAEHDPTRRPSLAGRRILVVEDEALIAMLLDDILSALDCAVVGPAPTLAKGMALAETEALDGALLDINLDNDPVYPLADLLIARDVPIVFTTGYGAEGVAEGYRSYRTLSKPFTLNTVEEALRHILSPQA